MCAVGFPNIGYCKRLSLKVTSIKYISQNILIKQNCRTQYKTVHFLFQLNKIFLSTKYRDNFEKSMYECGFTAQHPLNSPCEPLMVPCSNVLKSRPLFPSLYYHKYLWIHTYYMTYKSYMFLYRSCQAFLVFQPFSVGNAC